MKNLLHLFDKTFLKFILVGIANTIFGTAIMFVLYNVFNVGYWSSSAANYFFGSIFSFFLNKYFTFKVKTWNIAMVLTFILNIAVCYFIAYGVARPFVNNFLRDNPQNIRENIALFTGMCLFVGLNYLGQRFIVFKEKDVK